MLDPALGVCITLQVMAITRQSPCGQHAIGPVFKGPEYQQWIKFTRAWQLHDLYLGRILHPQPAGQIRRRVGAVLAAVGDNL